MNTTTKPSRKALDQIYFDYLLNCIPDSERILNEYGQNCPTDTDRINFVLRDFERVANHPYNLRMFPNLQDRFADWLRGAPGVLSIDFANYTIEQLCIKWGVLSESDTERRKEQIVSNWFNYMANKFFKLAKKHKCEIKY